MAGYFLSSGGIDISSTRRHSSSGFSSLVSAIGHARLFVYREVRAGSSAGYPVGHLVTSVPGENLTQNLRLQGAGPYVKSLWVSLVPKTTIVSPLVSPFFLGYVKSSHLRVDQIRPDQTLALPSVYFGNGLALFGIKRRKDLLPLFSILLLIVITGSEHSSQSQAHPCHV